MCLPEVKCKMNFGKSNKNYPKHKSVHLKVNCFAPKTTLNMNIYF